MIRLIAVFVFLGTLMTSAFHRRKAAQQAETIPRRSESTTMIVGRLLVALPLFGSVVLYLVNPAWMSWSTLDLPSVFSWAGVVIGLVVIPLAHWVLSHLGRNVSPTVLTKDDQSLVVSGPYRRVRHPLYSVGVLLFVSVGLMAANWFILLCACILAFAVRAFVVPLEEERLIDRFGSEYEAYRARTGSMIPWPGAGGR